MTKHNSGVDNSTLLKLLAQMVIGEIVEYDIEI